MDIVKHVRRTGLVGLAAVLMASTSALAQDGAVEEVVVTGSYIKQSPEDSALPIDVVDSEELLNMGNPSVVELVKTLGVSSGTDGETNQFQSNGLEGTANINLRGLGAGRNLVLLNGKRNNFSPYPVAEQQQLFVDINNIPGVALNRVEVLKDGAAATYGSDAISGVVNFITRSDFEGLEIAASHKMIADSDGDSDFGLIWGQDMGPTHIMASFGYTTRSQLMAKDRDWAIQTYGTNGNYQGYTGIPNPGTFFPLTDAGGPSFGGFITDPECENFIGSASFAARDPLSGVAKCTYSYVYFDNLIEKEERTNFFSEVTHEFDDETTLSVELMMANAEVPEWHSSPSYPPQTLFDTSAATGRYVPSYHPAFADMVSKYPTEFAGVANLVDADCAVTSQTDRNCDALIFFGRPFGISGPSAIGYREHDTFRFAAQLEGVVGDMNYDVSLVSSSTDATRISMDTYAERWAQAIRGFGGPDCANTTLTPGENGCSFYNPFSNSIQTPQSKTAITPTNANYSAANANPAALREWMSFGVGSNVETDITVFDAVLSGEASAFDWAVGMQMREENYDAMPFAPNDLSLNPCQTEAENERFRASGAAYDSSAEQCDAGTPNDTSDDYTGSGAFIFLAGASPFSDSQNITAVFGEARADLNDKTEVQLSVRYEDYGGLVGSSFDPKVALRYEASDALVLRGSASTTFRGPTLNQLGGSTTSLSYVGPTATFKAVDLTGNPNLEPEAADTLNLGAVYDVDGQFSEDDNLFVSLDYYSISFSDPIIRESFNDLIAAAFDNDGNIIANSPVAGRFNTSDGTSAGIQRIRVEMINGPDMETDGIDLTVRYAHDMAGARMTWSGQLNRVMSFDVGSRGYINAFDALGRTNENVDYLRPLIEDRMKLSVNYLRDIHSLTFAVNHIGEYDDNPATRTVESHTTYNVNYNVDLSEMTASDTALFVQVYNLTDEDPPYARLDLNYDPYTHNAFGRMIKVGARHKF